MCGGYSMLKNSMMPNEKNGMMQHYQQRHLSICDGYEPLKTAR